MKRKKIYEIFCVVCLLLLGAGLNVRAQQGECKMKCVAVGKNGVVWAVNANDRVFRWNGTSWDEPTPGALLKQISVGEDGAVWGVNSGNQIWRLSGTTWISVPGALKHVSTGSASVIWGVNSADQIWTWNGNWNSVPGGLSQVDAAADGSVWGVNKGEKIWRRDGNTWTNIPGALIHVSVGSANQVWGVNRANQIWHWVNNTWVSVPGALKQIDVAADGSVWGVNSGNQVWQYTGIGWKEIVPSVTLLTCGRSTDHHDGDRDNIADSCEQFLAEKFAPIVIHSSDESNYPANVDWLISKTSLWAYDDNCESDFKVKILNLANQSQLLSHSVGPTCGSGESITSDGTRSNRKQHTFFLEDLPQQFRIGSLDPTQWTTYFHAYRNVLGGVTIQYWRVYAYNDAINNHGGDWEGFHLVLNSALTPVGVDLLGHTTIDRVAAANMQWEGDHPIVFSEGGGHATRTTGDGIQARNCPSSTLPCVIDLKNPRTYVRQETFPGGVVRWFDGRVKRNGRLLNIGEKQHPLNGQVFIRYSGIWGSPGTTYEFSGYWGPAFNETGMQDTFITAWCKGMQCMVQASQECHPSAVSR